MRDMRLRRTGSEYTVGSRVVGDSDWVYTDWTIKSELQRRCMNLVLEPTKSLYYFHELFSPAEFAKIMIMFLLILNEDEGTDWDLYTRGLDVRCVSIVGRPGYIVGSIPPGPKTIC